MASNAFLGSGMKFPPQIDPATGKFAVSEGAESVKESIYLILMTNVGERIMQPMFGSSLQNYTFMDVNLTTVNMMIMQLTEEIQSHEPRVEDVDITVDAVTRKGCLIIDIKYTIIETNIRENMVFPFYLDTLIEEEEYNQDQYQDGGYNGEPDEEITD